MNDLSNERLVTTQELARIYGIGESTVKRAVEKLRPVLTPLLRNSQGGFLFNEEQVTMIKKEIQSHHNLQSRQIDNVSTELEENEIILKAQALLTQRIKRLEAELEEQNKTIDVYNRAIGTTNTYSMAEACKLLNLPYGRNKLYSVLRDKGILRHNNEPYQQYVQYFDYKIEYNTNLGKNVSYTRVTTKGLDYLGKIL